jgi:hypothetical protein
MNCPKCNAIQNDGNEICTDCGIVFAKYFKYNSQIESLAQSQEPLTHSNDSTVDILMIEDISLYERIKTRIFSVADNEDPIYVVGRGLLLLGMSYLSFRLMTSTIASNYAGEIFLHTINLPFHEAGHVGFRLFGSFFASLGGTLGQLLMPAVLFYHFLFRANNPFGGAVCLWWFGENFIDMAPYINDARDGDLPLIGGNFGHSSPYGFHDWEYILNESGLLQYDKIIAKMSFMIGSIIMILALIWGGILLYRQFKTVNN